MELEVFENKTEDGGVAHRAARREANVRTASRDPVADRQGHVEFGCECLRVECERSVRVPLYVYRRVVEAGDQYLLHSGHHAFAQYRTIVAFGLLRIEESV
jgi:hypothetical protein